VASSTTGSVLESMLGSIHENVLRANWKLTVEQARSMQTSANWSVLESMAGSVLENILKGIVESVLGTVSRVYRSV